MDFLKKYLIAIGYTLAIIFGATLIITILNYFDIIGNNVFKWIKLFIPIIGIFVGGFYVGKYANKKGYLEGLKFGATFVALIFVFALLGFGYSKWTLLLYYSILILSSMLGSMLGINRKKENNQSK